MNISHEILKANEGHPKIQIKLTKAIQVPGRSLFDCYTYDPPGLSKTGSLGRVNVKLAVKTNFFFNKSAKNG